MGHEPCKFLKIILNFYLNIYIYIYIYIFFLLRSGPGLRAFRNTRRFVIRTLSLNAPFAFRFLSQLTTSMCMKVFRKNFLREKEIGLHRVDAGTRIIIRALQWLV